MNEQAMQAAVSQILGCVPPEGDLVDRYPSLKLNAVGPGIVRPDVVLKAHGREIHAHSSNQKQ